MSDQSINQSISQSFIHSHSFTRSTISLRDLVSLRAPTLSAIFFQKVFLKECKERVHMGEEGKDEGLENKGGKKRLESDGSVSST